MHTHTYTHCPERGRDTQRQSKMHSGGQSKLIKRGGEARRTMMRSCHRFRTKAQPRLASIAQLLMSTKRTMTQIVLLQPPATQGWAGGTHRRCNRIFSASVHLIVAVFYSGGWEDVVMVMVQLDNSTQRWLMKGTASVVPPELLPSFLTHLTGSPHVHNVLR